MRHVLEMVGFDFIRGYNFGEGVLFWGQLDYSESLVHFSMLSGEPCALSPVVRAHRYFTIEDTPTSVNIKIYNISLMQHVSLLHMPAKLYTFP